MTDEYRGDPDPDAAANTGEPSDAELITAVRAGATVAFDALYRRHIEAAKRMARVLARDPSDVDDLVAESFARMLSILSAGGGPDVAFRSYLLTTMRNLFYERIKQDRRVQVTDDLLRHEAGEPFVDTAVEQLELSLVSRAFAKLPQRWQTVLWHTEVERERAATVATLLGTTPNGVAALAYRARERLRQHYLQEHIAADAGDDCHWATVRLGAYVRDGLARRDQARVEAHLAECRRCHLLFVELGDVNSRMREVLASALLASSASGYLASGEAAAASAGALSGPFRRIIRRRSTQVVGVASVILAAMVAVALTLVSQPAPTESPGAAQPPGRPAAPDDPAPATVLPVSPSATPSPSAPGTADLEITLEPVGSLVRGRPGMLALMVIHRGAEGARPVAFGPRSVPMRVPAAPDTGPLTAVLTVPPGVTLRAGPSGDGWQCAASGGGITCSRASLSAGQTSRGFVPVNVSTTAAGGELRARLTAPRATATSAARFGAVQTGGLAATFAATMPATVVTGGNRLMSCATIVLLGCLGNDVDNGGYYMTSYRDRAAPGGAPSWAMVSGADIPVRGEVVWAGLFWSGSGPAPANPTAHLRIPGTTRYAPVRAGRVDQVTVSSFTQPAYQASADVTGLVRGTKGGVWWVAVGQAFHESMGSFGGWALLLVVKDAGPMRTVTVFDGFQPVTGPGSVAMPVYAAAGAQARIAFIGWEGDRGISGDQIKLGGQPLGGAHSGNIASSATDGTLASWNTFGVDARAFDGRLPSGPGPLAVTATTTADAWILGAIAVASVAPQ